MQQAKQNLTTCHFYTKMEHFKMNTNKHSDSDFFIPVQSYSRCCFELFQKKCHISRQLIITKITV